MLNASLTASREIDFERLSKAEQGSKDGKSRTP
jgi:hypothetical protein